MQEKGEFFRNLSEIIRIYRKLAEAARCRGHTPLNNKTRNSTAGTCQKRGLLARKNATPALSLFRAGVWRLRPCGEGDRGRGMTQRQATEEGEQPSARGERTARAKPPYARASNKQVRKICSTFGLRLLRIPPKLRSLNLVNSK